MPTTYDQWKDPTERRRSYESMKGPSVRDQSAKRWQRASTIAVAALGKTKCDDDPLAYWLLVELIYDYGNNRK